MIQSDIDAYESAMVEPRAYTKWHPWAQFAIWMTDWEFYHEFAFWSIREMRKWLKQKLEENCEMVEEVNDNPLHEGLIYPEGTEWIDYVLKDIVKLGWLMRDSCHKKYRTDECDCVYFPAEWLASQILGACGEEMIERGIPFDENRMKLSWDLGYTDKWEEITGLGLLDAPQWI